MQTTLWLCLHRPKRPERPVRKEDRHALEHQAIRPRLVPGCVAERSSDLFGARGDANGDHWVKSDREQKESLERRLGSTAREQNNKTSTITTSRIWLLVNVGHWSCVFRLV